MPRFHYFVSSRMGTGLQDPYYAQLGLGLDGQFRLSRRWQVSLGLHYQETWPYAANKFEESLSGEFSQDQGESAPTFDNTGRLTVSSPALERLSTRQLGLELRGLLRLSPRWQLGMGMELFNYRAAYLGESIGVSPNLGVAMNLDDFNVYNNEVQVVNSSREETPVEGEESGFPLELNRWQYAAAVGVQYQIHRRWQLGLDWRQQLSTLSAQLPDLQLQTAVQLRVRYRLR
jgi:hypothetical protein